MEHATITKIKNLNQLIADDCNEYPNADITYEVYNKITGTGISISRFENRVCVYQTANVDFTIWGDDVEVEVWSAGKACVNWFIRVSVFHKGFRCGETVTSFKPVEMNDLMYERRFI